LTVARSAAAVVPRVPLVWRMATVVELLEETAHARTLVLEVPGWPGHAAGQHLDVRLTAEDGYVAERSYSIASAPEEARVALTVERIDDGEVSPYLAGELVVGDQFEVRGPVGGHFTWRAVDGGPLLLVAGGSGLVPLMAMLRHRAAVASRADARLLVSAREVEALLYRDELERLGGAGDGLSITYTLTRVRPEGWTGFARRVDAAMLKAVGPPAAAAGLRSFVCGPTPFVEAVADALVGLGHEAAAVHTERFGPTGG
jgi:ferredoxin-NADP reductase